MHKPVELEISLVQRVLAWDILAVLVVLLIQTLHWWWRWCGRGWYSFYWVKSTGPGGDGRKVSIAEPSSTPAVQASVGAPGPGGFTGSYFAGGGGGGGETGSGGGDGGGGNGAPNNDTYGYPGLPGSGGGGGGARTPSDAGGGRGGSGIAIIRYQIPGSQGTAKACWWCNIFL